MKHNRFGRLIILACALIIVCACPAFAHTEPRIVGGTTYRIIDPNTIILPEPFTAEEAEASLQGMAEGTVDAFWQMIDAVSYAYDKRGLTDPAQVNLRLEGEHGTLKLLIQRTPFVDDEGAGLVREMTERMRRRDAVLREISWSEPGLVRQPPRGIDVGASFSALMEAYRLSTPDDEGIFYDNRLMYGTAADENAISKGLIRLDGNGNTCIELTAGTNPEGTAGYRLTYVLSEEKVQQIILEFVEV